MSNRIDIVITEAPQVDTSTPPLINANLTDEATGFSWTIAAQGGFKSAQIDCVVPRARAFEILQRFTSKRVIFTSPTALNLAQVCWEGMVYQVSVDDGKRKVTRSMANVYNSVTVAYSSTDYTQATPQGAQVATVTLTDSPSQALYGFRQLVYTVGEMNSTDATRLATILLARYGYPQTVIGGESVGDAPGGNEVRVSIDCVGYGEVLDKYIYTSALTTTQSLDTLVKNVITAHATAGPTQILSTNYANVTVNSLTRPRWQLKNITALDYINDVCAYGSGSFAEQNLFGVTENRQIYYNPFPSTLSYWQSMFDSSERVYSYDSGGVVDPWNVRPGKLIAIGDILPDTGYPYDFDVTDVEQFLIGEVKFTAPNKLALTPWTGDPTQVVLHRIGAANE